VREKELRLALVCFGGISLAVYMHGISKEILKLVRASRTLHRMTDRARRATARFEDTVSADDPEYDTEAVYFDLLRTIGRRVELRVIVDVIAGASAGGINGVMLGRALAHDLPVGHLREMWLQAGDVGELLAQSGRAKAWSKLFMAPLVWALGWSGRSRAVRNPEVRQKLSLLVRSRWFKPPFDGDKMSGLMFDAVDRMGDPADPDGSLMPGGQQLEMFVTLTDFYGYQQLIQIHDPALIREREHRHVLRFSYRRFPDGEVQSDFRRDNAAALAFAARATSAYPGAFPPAQIREMDRVIAARGCDWPGRARFLHSNFQRYHRAGLDPLATSFIDGSVLNNKPFAEALAAIRDRPAYRQVDRRLVYIDPDPVQPPPPPSGRVPGFFATLKGALSDLPRNEPISDELGYIAGFNERVRRLRAIVDSARPQIARLVTALAEAAIEGPFSVAQIHAWREAANARAAHDAGFAYQGYVRLKLDSVRTYVAGLIASICGLRELSPEAQAVDAIVEAWAQRHGIVYSEEAAPPGQREGGTRAAPAWVKFLLAFDVEFRKRRLVFLIQGQNRLYAMLGTAGTNGDPTSQIDALKRDFYRCLDRLRRYEKPEFYSAQTRSGLQSLFSAPLTKEQAGSIGTHARAFAAANETGLTRLIEGLAAEIDLDAATHDVDVLLARMDPAQWHPQARREVLVNYIGFPFWDVLTFSVTSWRDLGEFDEIRIDRISPEDASTLRRGAAADTLKGTAFLHFGAFFSRAFRENDYLWGRLHAIDRLIDIVCDSAGADAVAELDVPALKRRAFDLVLRAEEKHLPHVHGLIEDLRAELARLESDAQTDHGRENEAASASL
jgi:patatin-related protein